MVLRDLGDDPVAGEEGAGVADVGDDDLVAGAEQRDEGGSHAVEAGLVPHVLAELGVGGEDPVEEGLAHVAPAERLVVEVDERGDDGRARDVAARVAPHAVGHREEVGSGIRRVLVVGPDHADVGPGGVVERERHPLPLQLHDGLADPQHAADRHVARLGQARRAEEGAVRGAEVLDHPLAVVGLEDPGVPARGVVVVEDERALRAAPDEGARGSEREGGAGERPRGDDEPGRALAASRPAVAAGRPGRAGGAPGGAAARPCRPRRRVA